MVIMKSKYLFFIILIFIVFLNSCTSKVVIEVKDYIPKKIDGLVDKNEIIESDSPMDCHQKVCKTFEEGLKYSKNKNDLLINNEQLIKGKKLCNFFLMKNQNAVYEWTDDQYLPIILYYAGKISLYQIMVDSYKDQDSFYLEKDAFYKWNKYLKILYQSRYYFSLLNETDFSNNLAPEFILNDNPIETGDAFNETTQKSIESLKKGAKERIYTIENGFWNISALPKYVYSEVLRQEIAEKESIKKRNILGKLEEKKTKLSLEKLDINSIDQLEKINNEIKKIDKKIKKFYDEIDSYIVPFYCESQKLLFDIKTNYNNWLDDLVTKKLREVNKTINSFNGECH